VQTNFIYRDGMRGFAPVDPISIDRVEIIKGPSSFFGGQVQAGGFANYVTKQPTGKSFTALRQSFASYDTYRTEMENSGGLALGQDKKLLYRVALAYSVNDTFREFEHQKKSQASHRN
jgi:iron complex outermembrane receptor protein